MDKQIILLPFFILTVSGEVPKETKLDQLVEESNQHWTQNDKVVGAKPIQQDEQTKAAKREKYLQKMKLRQPFSGTKSFYVERKRTDEHAFKNGTLTGQL